VPGTLTLRIAQCSDAQSCLATGRPLACREIVRSQAATSAARFQVPEPWSGRLDEARLLFVSSNPSISPTEVYPSRSWTDQQICDFFDNRFEGRYVQGGVRYLQQDGSYSKSVPYWRKVLEWATDLFPGARPGRDYALTEVVHCKSKGQQGVATALSNCSNRYTDAIADASVAKTIVVVGAFARDEIKARYGLARQQVIGPIMFRGRQRMIAFVMHPAGFGAHDLLGMLGATDLARLQAWTQSPP
jgi:hypothetical protein